MIYIHSVTRIQRQEQTDAHRETTSSQGANRSIISTYQNIPSHWGNVIALNINEDWDRDNERSEYEGAAKKIRFRRLSWYGISKLLEACFLVLAPDRIWRVSKWYSLVVKFFLSLHFLWYGCHHPLIQRNSILYSRCRSLFKFQSSHHHLPLSFSLWCNFPPRIPT